MGRRTVGLALAFALGVTLLAVPQVSGGTLAEYRAMVINHETAHWFGLGHGTCGGRGKPAPAMMQQSKGLYGCKPSPWPLLGEIARVR